jgi:hypothetical protein
VYRFYEMCKGIMNNPVLGQDGYIHIAPLPSTTSYRIVYIPIHNAIPVFYYWAHDLASPAFY